MQRTVKVILKHTQKGGSFQSVAEGDDDPYEYEYCQKDHWSGCSVGEELDEGQVDPWKDCVDYEKETDE